MEFSSVKSSYVSPEYLNSQRLVVHTTVHLADLFVRFVNRGGVKGERDGKKLDGSQYFAFSIAGQEVAQAFVFTVPNPWCVSLHDSLAAMHELSFFCSGAPMIADLAQLFDFLLRYGDFFNFISVAFRLVEEIGNMTLARKMHWHEFLSSFFQKTNMGSSTLGYRDLQREIKCLHRFMMEVTAVASNSHYNNMIEWRDVQSCDGLADRCVHELTRLCVKHNCLAAGECTAIWPATLRKCV